MSKKYTLEVKFEGLSFEICGTYTPPVRGVNTLKNGDPGYPPEDETFEIDEVRLVEGKVGGETNLLEWLEGMYRQYTFGVNARPIYSRVLDRLEGLALEELHAMLSEPKEEG